MICAYFSNKILSYKKKDIPHVQAAPPFVVKL